MMKTHLSRGALWAALALAASACDCGGTTSQRNPALEERATAVDFGSVQLGVEHQRTLVLYNAGNDSLNIASLEVDPPFGIVDEAPLSIGVGEERELTVTFLPTVKDKRELGSLRISSDDPERPTVRVSLSGTGIQAVATATPNPLAFGDVWVGENKTVTVTINNGGSNELTVVDAQLLDTTPDSVTADLGPLRQNIPAGGQTQASVRFAPTQIGESLPGGIRLELLPEQGGELVVPFSGRGVRAVPRLCFRLGGSGMETCTDPNAAMGVGNSLNIALPPLCDAKVSPPDSGFDPCQGTPYQLQGQFYVKNEGNAEVAYSMKYTATVDKSCDGGVQALPDFQFSNAPSPGSNTWNVPTVSLGPMDEAAPVDAVYTATAECENEASDQAQIVWTRQGDLRQPNVLFATLTGQSKLPHAVTANQAFTSGMHGSSVGFLGAANQGIAEFAVTDVQLKWIVAPEPAGSCAPTDGGNLQTCNGFENDPLSWCSMFAWHADAGNPNDRPLEQRVIPVSSGAGIGSREIGRLVFSPNPSTSPPPNQQAVCVYAVVGTTDPFRQTIISQVKGTYSP
jgi:hypothetical protein